MFKINKKTAYYSGIAVFLLLLDRFLKIYSIKYLVDKDILIFGNVFKLNLVYNPGIAFSLPLSGIFLIIIIVFLILALIWELCKNYKLGNYDISGIILIITFGAVSNLWDRFMYGSVIDYFDLAYFTVFNLADSMISIGVLTLAYMLYRNEKLS